MIFLLLVWFFPMQVFFLGLFLSVEGEDLLWWVGLELMGISFLFFSGSFQWSLFVVQSVSGYLLLFSSLYEWDLLELLSVSLKLGLFPFYKWVIYIVYEMSFFSVFLFFTLYKMPLFCLLESGEDKGMVSVLGSLTSVAGVFMGLGSEDLKEMYGCSSISSGGWISVTLSEGGSWEEIFFYYMLISGLLVGSVVWGSSESRYCSMGSSVCLMSLMGLPPLGGFLLKLNMLSSMSFSWFFICSVGMLISFYSGFFYMSKVWSSWWGKRSGLSLKDKVLIVMNVVMLFIVG